MKYKILLIGPQGSGKGTQAKKISEKLNIPIFSVGNILRQRSQEDDDLARKIREKIDIGLLAPDELVNSIVQEKIEEKGGEGYILDGYPRNMAQAEYLHNYQELTHVLMIDVSDEMSLKRISGRRTCPKCQAVYHLDFKTPKVEGICDIDGEKLENRKDDTPDAIRGRLEIYHKQTKPIIDFYQKQGLVHEVNGEQNMENVDKEAQSVLKI
jgi:adenylate kinase